MLKWTLRVTAILAIAAAIATPVAVSAPEAVIATPAVTAPASAPDAPRAELTSAVHGETRSDLHVAF
ncbi:hypothetical protein [Streptomyces sp. NBC_00162]|uniref:hypothetical protein n=1 Tax=Streptomyces sp. NBC_00162 TaxID=2903629 RepID=UPI00214D0FDA|nr:hypothetical protein [Streptomyces sp. NBC_00162]UUU38059.1 hypothetical protein JIW86_03805 [Streptomyces sp. NBC_00162]